MKIISLVDNISSSPEYKCKHGLSFYIETINHKILFDLGADGLFLENAKKLNVDISSIDTVIISHGHKDHGGALKLFLKNNQFAKVYIQKTAFEKYYTKFLGIPIFIGLDASLKSHPQVVLIDEYFVIDSEIALFSNVTERECYPLSNKRLFVKRDDGMTRDSFEHEHNLIITENDKYTLISGCAHNGILNIQKKAEGIIERKLDFLISGFHLYNPSSKKHVSEELIETIANKLKQNSTKYYTCHCTGKKAFLVLKNILGEQIDYLSVGEIIKL